MLITRLGYLKFEGMGKRFRIGYSMGNFDELCF
jgi:hypothetical protein